MRRTIYCTLTIALFWAATAGTPRSQEAGLPGDGPAVKIEECPEFPFDPLSSEAFDLLAESAADSCAVCARERRGEAFAILDESLRPGDILHGAGHCPFVLTTGGDSELRLACFAPNKPRLTFRFHTTANHYVGIASGDYTADSLAARFLSLPPDTPILADIRIIPFPYGNGETFLYHVSANHLQIQCEVSAIRGQ